MQARRNGYRTEQAWVCIFHLFLCLVMFLSFQGRTFPPSSNIIHWVALLSRLASSITWLCFSPPYGQKVITRKSSSSLQMTEVIRRLAPKTSIMSSTSPGGPHETAFTVRIPMLSQARRHFGGKKPVALKLHKEQSSGDACLQGFTENESHELGKG